MEASAASSAAHAAFSGAWARGPAGAAGRPPGPQSGEARRVGPDGVCRGVCQGCVRGQHGGQLAGRDTADFRAAPRTNLSNKDMMGFLTRRSR